MLVLANPPHPGDFIRTEVIEAGGLTVTGAAEALGISRSALSAFLNGRANLSPEMAIRIEKAFGLKMEILMRMQSAYDIAQARRMAKRIRGVRRHSIIAVAR